MKPRPFWFALGALARAAAIALMGIGAVLGYLLVTRIAPFRYMEF